MSSDAESVIEDAETAIRIVENGRLVGAIDIDRKTGEYAGQYSVISERIEQMEEQGIWQQRYGPVEWEPGDPREIPSSEFEVTGEGLGNYFLLEIGAIQYRNGDDDDELQTEAIGFEADPELQ